MNAIQYLFENTAELEKDFVLGNRETISFKNLFQQSSQLAVYLSETTGADQNIILLSQNNNFFIVCYLGIMMSGNVCVPLDPEIEKDNLEYIIEKSDAALCFMQSRIKEKCTGSNLKVITEKDYLEYITGKPDFKIPQNFDSERPAQIIFTSGSTGKPKGVILSHKNLISNTASILNYLHLTENDIIEVVLPFFYCYGLSLLHTHLRVGGSMVLNNSFILTGTVINDINKYKCTGFAGVPSHFQILLRTGVLKNSELPSLRYVTQAGGKLHNIFIEEFIKVSPEIDFFVMYGQTEATARLSYLEPDLLKRKLGSIGKGIPGVELKVVDDSGDVVRPGEAGEIIARGDNIMTGYYKEPEMTNEVLKDGWLYTGDIGTTDSEGFIFLTARNKEFVKIAGNRVSLKEIEAVILSYPQIVDCYIEPVFDENLGEVLKATIMYEEGSKEEINADLIRKHCAARLAAHKIPKYFEFAENLKITSTGKKIKPVS